MDGDDVGLFMACVSGTTVPPAFGCENRDFDGDNDVDLSDFGLLQRCYGGSGQPADPDCAD